MSNTPTQMPPQTVVNTLLATDRGIKKPTITRVLPPENGIDAPKFTPPLPMPTAVDIDAKEPTVWKAQPVGGLWTSDQNLNGWLWFEKENWLRLSEASESGLLAMLMIAASGKETGTPCLYRKDAEGKIRELYVL